MDASIGRIAGLEGSPQKGPESAPKPSFHCEREIGLAALSRRSYPRCERRSSVTLAESRSRWKRFAISKNLFAQILRMIGSPKPPRLEQPREALRREGRSRECQRGCELEDPGSLKASRRQLSGSSPLSTGQDGLYSCLADRRCSTWLYSLSTSGLSIGSSPKAEATMLRGKRLSRFKSPATAFSARTRLFWIMECNYSRYRCKYIHVLGCVRMSSRLRGEVFLRQFGSFTSSLETDNAIFKSVP